MDKKLLDVLVCPVTGAALAPANEDTLARVNTTIEAGEARHADGSPVEQILEQALITSDNATLYRIDDGIPMMLPDRAIEVR